MNTLDALIQRAQSWSEEWTAAWDDDGEPVDDYDAIYALEDEARDIVQALAMVRS